MKIDRLLRKILHQKTMSILLAVTAVAIVTALMFSQYAEYKQAQQLKSIYGQHNVVVTNISGDTKEKMISHWSCEDSAEISAVAEVVDEEGNYISYLGLLDSHFPEMENWELLDGRWPQNKHEIVAEQLFLDRLHLEYATGTDVVLNLIGPDKSETVVSVTLVGILKTYTSNWQNQSDHLAGCFVSEWADEPIATDLFMITKHHNADEANELTSLKNRGSRIVWNMSSFSEKSNEPLSSLTKNIFILVMVLCLICIVCVQLSIQPGIRKGSIILCRIGAKKRMLIRQLYLEYLQEYLKCLLIGAFAAAFLALIFTCFGNCINPTESIVILSIGLLIMCIVSATMSAFAIAIRKSPKEKNNYKETKHRQSSDISQFTLQRFICIQQKQFRKYHLSQLFVTVIALIVFSTCSLGIFSEIESDTLRKQAGDYDYLWYASAPGSGLNNNQIQSIAAVDEIKEILHFAQYNSYDTAYMKGPRLIWDSCKNDPYRIAANQMLPVEENEALPVIVSCIPEESKLFSHFFGETADPSALLSDEKAVLYMPTLLYGDDGTVQMVNTLANQHSTVLGQIPAPFFPGEKMVIRCDNRDIDIECSYVMTHLPGNKQTKYDFIVPCTVIVSPKLWCHIFDKPEVLWNEVRAWGTHALSYESGDVLMSRINAKAKNVTYDNLRSFNDEQTQKTWLAIAVYSVILLLVLSLSIVILWRIKQSFDETEKPHKLMLERIGMKKDILKKAYRNRMIWLLPVILFIADLVIVTLFFRGMILMYAPNGFINMIKLLCTYLSTVYGEAMLVWFILQVVAISIWWKCIFDVNLSPNCKIERA